MRRLQAWLATDRGRRTGLAAAVALAVLAVAFGRLAGLDPSVRGPGIVGLELAGVPGVWTGR
ncbi:hypothetical protein [Nocardioides panaciterrulae]|uniref:Uncharacterized protein n=1 Tax=Nocardioides panaciterrulae TaxID=661492 RepID=A0A7Y9E8Q0_9ACTN|nr:hypothetical protein [Nocardioides panaciterrulae]NYD43286.1 hypothetical protein [Nocardioides panaciterrulae]